MANYFDLSNNDHLNLLHSGVREHPELQVIAAQVEYEVINHFRERRNYRDEGLNLASDYDVTPYENEAIDTAVMLSGYKEVPEDAEPNFRQAMAHTVAYVISNVLRQYDNDRGLEGEGRGKRSWDYATGGLPTKDDWPKDWKRFLSIYDNKETLYYT